MLEYYVYMPADTQYKFRRVNLHKNDTQLTRFEMLGNESRGTLRLDSQYDPILIESEDSPQVFTGIGKIIKKDKPVYVDEDNRLVYDSNRMETDAIYKVNWENNIIALRKNVNGKVDFYEFEPDSV